MRSQEEFRLSCFVADTLRRFARPSVVWFHVPNGEHRSAMTGARLKRMGVRRGVADFIIFHDWSEYASCVLFLELKSRAGRLSPEQKAFRDAVVALGYDYDVADTGQGAIEILKSRRILTNVRVAA